MLFRVGDKRSPKIDLLLAAALSFIAGALNAVGFLTAGSFTANMTGNISAMADHVALRNWLPALSFGALVLWFILGAAIAGLMITFGERRGKGHIYLSAVLLEAALLILLGLALLRAEGHILMMLLPLSFLMGFQNAVTTLISGARVRTTHVSGMATDIGIEIAALVGPKAERARALPKLTLHSVTLLCFTLGGITGAVAFGFAGYWVFILCGLALITLALPEIARLRRP